MPHTVQKHTKYRGRWHRTAYVILERHGLSYFQQTTHCEINGREVLKLTSLLFEVYLKDNKLTFLYLRDCSVGTATRYGLDDPRIESRWGAGVSAPVQTDPGAHPASYIMGIMSLARG